MDKFKYVQVETIEGKWLAVAVKIDKDLSFRSKDAFHSVADILGVNGWEMCAAYPDPSKANIDVVIFWFKKATL